MRTSLLLALALAPLITYAGKEPEIVIPFDEETNKYGYSEVVEIPESKPEALYANAKAWILSKYLNEETKVDIGDEKVVFDGSFPLSTTVNGAMGVKIPISFTILFDIVLEFKDGKYRYQLTNIKLSQNALGTTLERSLETFVTNRQLMGMGRKVTLNIIEGTCVAMHEEFSKVINELQAGMTGSLSGKNDNW